MLPSKKSNELYYYIHIGLVCGQQGRRTQTPGSGSLVVTPAEPLGVPGSKSDKQTTFFMLSIYKSDISLCFCFISVASAADQLHLQQSECMKLPVIVEYKGE